MTRIATLFVAATLAIGCINGSVGDGDDSLVGVEEPDDEGEARDAEALVGSVSAGSQLRTNAALNLRTQPSKSAKILHVIPDGAIVTVVSGTPKSGWYNIKHGGQTGWSHGDYLDKVSGVVGPASCAPARATGVVSAKRKALLDTIAFAEGTKGRGYDGYNILYSYQTISDCNRHPDRVICSGSYCSSAAGRYQFLDSTWAGLKLPNFRPENQTRGAMTLISRRGGSVPSDRAMTATEFANLMNKISYEWASLPPGRYGQPMRSMSSLRGEYCKYAGC
jgi:muramidase (phage lysozyme)